MPLVEGSSQLPLNTHNAFSFSYDAGYYGYIYSECFAADLFSQFDTYSLSKATTSVIDARQGKEYREKILAIGATKCGNDMLKDFLNREPSKLAFFDRVKLHID